MLNVVQIWRNKILVDSDDSNDMCLLNHVDMASSEPDHDLYQTLDTNGTNDLNAEDLNDGWMKMFSNISNNIYIPTLMFQVEEKSTTHIKKN